jgi:hypothetical protein
VIRWSVSTAGRFVSKKKMAEYGVYLVVEEGNIVGI